MVHVRQEVYLKSSFGTPSIKKINRPLLPFPIRKKAINDKPIKEKVLEESLPVIIIPIELKPDFKTIEPPLESIIPQYFGEENEHETQVY